MEKQIKDNRHKFHKKIIDKLDNYSYRKKRYKLSFSITVAISDKKIDLSEFIKLKRKTDEFIVLQDNICCIIFDGTSSDSAIKLLPICRLNFNINTLMKNSLLV